MAGLKQIKSKIRSIEKTRKVTKAMEAVSAAKMRKAQASALAARSYARAASGILKRLSGSKALANHPLAHIHPEGTRRALYIVVTSDKGLAGGLNSNVLRTAAKDIAQTGLPQENVRIIALGRKAHDFFMRRGFELEAFLQNSLEHISSDIVQELVEKAAFRFTLGEADLVRIIYPRFVSTFEQRPTVRTVFPLSSEELEQVVADIVPARGKYSDIVEEATPAVYTVEPSEQEVLDAIVPRLASIFVYHALLESQACEHSARMVAMKSASDKGAELAHAFTLKFNKARQAAITREVSEITGGMEAMAG